MHMQHMLKIGRGLYTGGNFKQNIWKKRRKIGDLIYHHDLTNERFGANVLSIKIYYVILLARLTSLHSENVGL